jgi:hypothetical protein
LKTLFRLQLGKIKEKCASLVGSEREARERGRERERKKEGEIAGNVCPCFQFAFQYI